MLDTGYRTVENPARYPIADAYPQLDPHSRVCWRHAAVRAFGIPQLSSVASGWYKYSVLAVHVRSVVSSPFWSPRSPTLSATTADFLLRYTLPRVSRARRTSLPRNYLRMIPIVGQIKTVLSAMHADRGERRSFVYELSVKMRARFKRGQNRMPGNVRLCSPQWRWFLYSAEKELI